MADSTSIEQPFPIFFDKVGKPLDSGYVYIGEYGKNPQTNPIQIFWDEALTQPAVQPIRTINGYYSRHGTPSRVFIQGLSCSITVRDKYQTVVYSDLKTSGKVAGLINASAILDDSGLNQQQINDKTITAVESIADLIAIQNPKDGQVVQVKGYYRPTNFALANPYKGSGFRIYIDSRKNENDKILCINGWVLLENKVTSSMCGCYVDGLTDDREFIQNAINVLSPLRIPLYLDSGIHLVRATTQEQWSNASPFFVRSYIFDNRSNMTLIGDGVSTVIKYADGAALIDFGATLFSSNPSVKLYNLHWEGLVIDQNGYNNKLEHNRAYVQSNQAIVLATGAKATIKNCTFKDFTGMQVIYSRQHFDWDDNTTGADEPFKDIEITGNTFIDCGWLDGTNWSMQGQHDHSTLFLTGTYNVRNNTFIQNTVGMYAGTCCELHGKGFLSGNTVRKYANAFLSVGMYRDADNTVIGNWVYDCTSIAYIDTRGVTKGFNNRLTLMSNFFRQATFYIDESTVFGQNRPMIGITGYGLIGKVYVVIKDNILETDGLYANRTPENIAKYNSVVQTQFFNSLVFEGNDVKNSKGSIFRIGKVVFAECDIISKGNTFTNCGSGDLTVMGNSVFYHDNENATDYGIKMNSVQSIDNKFIDCTHKYITTTTVEADGLLFPNTIVCTDQFYKSMPYTLGHSVQGDANQNTSFMYDVKCYRPAGNTDVVYNRPEDAWFSYNQWGTYTVYKEKILPIVHKKIGTAQNWTTS